MNLKNLILASITIVVFSFAMSKLCSCGKKEGMGGYGILSGLYFNNNARRTFRNPYDPPGYEYSETIGTVVI
jgi:hypothetical protein